MKIDTFTYFYPEAPRLMSIKSPSFQRMSDDPKWIAEKKYNGCRLQLHRLPMTWFFYNRHKELMAFKPSQDLMCALEAIQWKGYCLLDGELRNNKVVGIKQKIVFYDVFIWDGELLIDKTFKERREILQSLVPIASLQGNELLSCPYWALTGFKYEFERVTKDPEIEGLVMKNINGMLNLGRNSANDSSWMMKVRKESGRYRF